jgi:hypothetical protein
MTDDAKNASEQGFDFARPYPSYVTDRKGPRLVDKILKRWDDEEKAGNISCADIAEHFWGEPRCWRGLWRASHERLPGVWTAIGEQSVAVRPGPHLHIGETDCVAGHIGLEL